MRFSFVAFFLFVSVFVVGQTIRGDYDLTNYPEVSFVWNEYNPEIKDTTQFILTQGNQKIPFRVESITPIDTSRKAKTILFLWEDLNHTQHAGQSDFTRTVMSNFLKETNFSEGDKFNIAVFDRKGGNDLGSSIHTLLSNDFTSDSEKLAEAVRNFRPKYDFFSNQVNSELYMAIEEGIEMLQKEPSDRIRVIVVFTAGSNLDNYGGRNSIDENRALSLKIPIYVVKYPIRGCDRCSNIDVICQKTFGLQITTNDAAIATDLLKTGYAKINARHYGQDYRITFRSDFPRDGRQHAFVWNVGGKEYPLSFTAPAFSLKIWIKENILWAVLAGVVFLCLIGLIVFFVFRAKKKRRMELSNLQSKQQEIQQEANANRQTLEDYQRQIVEKERLDKERHFSKLMQTKNLFPRLQYAVDGKNATYTVHKPETSIGRDPDNDLVFLSDSVSRHHAKLIFNGASFVIHDLGSTNRVIVNGSFVEQATLTHGDIIGLGEIVVYFFS